MVQFKSLDTVSYLYYIVAMALSCNISEISEILVENRDFFHTLLYSMPPLVGFPAECCHNVWYAKWPVTAFACQQRYGKTHTHTHTHNFIHQSMAYIVIKPPEYMLRLHHSMVRGTRFDVPGSRCFVIYFNINFIYQFLVSVAHRKHYTIAAEVLRKAIWSNARKPSRVGALPWTMDSAHPQPLACEEGWLLSSSRTLLYALGLSYLQLRLSGPRFAPSGTNSRLLKNPGYATETRL